MFHKRDRQHEGGEHKGPITKVFKKLGLKNLKHTRLSDSPSQGSPVAQSSEAPAAARSPASVSASPSRGGRS